MGRIVVETTLENALDPSHTIRCDALVDTGAAYLTLPNAWRERLGKLTELDTVAVETANQSVIYGLPRKARKLIDSMAEEAHAVVYPASGVDSEWSVPTWNLRTSGQSLQAADVKLPAELSAW